MWLVCKSCLLLLVLSLFHGYSFSCTPEEMDALLEFRSLLLQNGTLSTRGTNPDTVLMKDWSSKSLNCCQWDGVTCERTEAAPLQVTEVKFLFVILPTKETISSSVLLPLFRLRALSSLNVAGNQLEGVVPWDGFLSLTHLVSLDLSKNRLSGSLPSQLFYMGSLEKLFLYSNMLSGSLELGSSNMRNRTSLQILNLSDNKLSGAIPDTIGNFKDLKVLVLYNNSFSMAIPSAIGSLPNLLSLKMDHNNLSGQIPNSLQRLSNLFQLTLHNNQLSGEIPPWIFDMKSLDLLDLGENQLTLGARNLAPKKQITVLGLSSCNLSGPIPFWLARQTGLEQLNLRNNFLRGTIPSWLAKKHTIQSLILADNNLTGSLPEAMFNKLSKLEILSLARNEFSGRLPENIGDVENMTTLMLSGNHLSGSLPKSMAKMSKLVWLDLSDNNFSGDVFPFASTDSSQLGHVSLSFNRFSGEVPTSFGGSVNVLQLNSNEFTVLPETVASLFNLTLLDLSDNHISGGIPPGIANLTNLKVLNLRNNHFQGFIPEDLSRLHSLQIFDASYNNLLGQIPPSLGRLSAMRINPFTFNSTKTFEDFNFYAATFYTVTEEINPQAIPDLLVRWKSSKLGLSGKNLQFYTLLDLSNNQLSGSIPSTLGDLTELKSLDLSNNKLSSSIPPSLGLIKHLESLNLSHNSLSGKIPKTFAKLLQLQNLDLSNNQLSGPIPGGRQMGVLDTPDIYANNSGLCGPQIRIACKENLAIKGKDTNLPRKEAAIGFVFGFLASVLALYVSGFFRFPSTQECLSSIKHIHWHPKSCKGGRDEPEKL